MTFKELTSPAVREWCHQRSLRIEEGESHSRENIMEDFSEWFNKNRDAINQSILNEDRKTIINAISHSILNEDRKTIINDIDDDDEYEVEDSKPKRTVGPKPKSSDEDGWVDADIDVEEGEDDSYDYDDEPEEDEPEEDEVEDDEVEDDDEYEAEVADEEAAADEVEDVPVEPTVDVEDEDEVEVDDDVEPSDDEDKFEEVREEPIDIDAPMEDKSKISSYDIDKMDEIMSSGSDEEYVVFNDPKNTLHHIFNVVNIWYDLACQDGTNKDEITFLYFLNTSNCNNMTALFAFANVPNLNLENWDTSNVRFMEGMFYKSTFNHPCIEKWDVSSCINFKNMFYASSFRYDISGWTPGSVPELVCDKDGRPVKEEVRKKDGSVVYIDKYEKKPAELPFVGARLSHAQLEKNRRMMNQMKTFDAAIERVKKEKAAAVSEMNHVYDFDTFVNEGIGDFINKGIYKAKSLIKSVAMKVGDVFSFFKKDGSPLAVMSPYTSMSYVSSGKVPGVSAYYKGDLNGVPSVAKEINKPGYYDFMKPGTQEYKNYVSFMNELNEGVKIVGDPMNEELMPLTAEGSGVGVPDITTTDFKKMLRELIHNNRYETGHAARTLIVFGAPGIGKSTIPNAIVNEYNNSIDKNNPQKALMAVDCGELTLDGFYLPIPKARSLEEISASYPKLYKIFSSDEEAFNRLKGRKMFQTIEAPKTWLPCYIPSADKAENKLLNDIANGYIDMKEVYNPETDSYEQVVRETTEGGILLFDEFFRANSEVFKNIKEIINTGHTLGGQVLGSKWSILACSNRPNDDDEVKNSRNESSPVLGNRFLRGAYNLVPEFEEWKVWAQDEGILDDFTLAFITGGAASDDSSIDNRYDMEVPDFSKEEEAYKIVKGYHRWHAVDPKKWKASDGSSTFMFPTPRTWSALLERIKEYIEETPGCESILDINAGDIRMWATGTIGKDTGNDYATYIKNCKTLPFRPYTRTVQNSEGKILGKREFISFPEVINKSECDSARACEYLTSYFVGHYTNKREGFLNPSDKQMLELANTLYKSYTLTGGSSHVTNFHNDVIRRVFNIKTTDEAKIKRYAKYLDFIMKEYGIKFADEAY